MNVNGNSNPVIQRARSSVGSAASIAVLHVVEYLPMEPLGEIGLPAMQVDKELVSRATRQLNALVDPLVDSVGLACEQFSDGLQHQGRNSVSRAADRRSLDCGRQP